VGHWLQGDMGEDRKNVGLLIKAFYEMFKNKSDAPALILKTSVGGTSYIGRREVMRRINTIKKTIVANNLPNIYVFSGEISDEEMNVLYNHPKVKAMVSLTKGEGFGRPLLEFTLTGKPVIAPGWSGQIDFLNPVFSTLIGGELKDIHPSAVVKDMLIENSKWFTPDLTQVAHHFHNCYINYKDYKKGAKSQQYKSKANFSWKAMKQELESILNNVPKIEAIQPMQLQLPKLKKIGEQNQELPKIQLPKLKKL
jgi:glycosyltransferase involved in cell wall biosynthesis